MTTSSVPILDCAAIAGSLEDVENKAEFKEFIKNLGDAISGIGFVYLVNHGIPHEIVWRYTNIRN